jgi:hypothetical protein
MAYDEIREYVSESQSVDLQEGVRTLRKFGRANLVTKSARNTIMTQGSTAVLNETLTTANLVDTLSSTATNAAVLGVQGYTVSTLGNLTFVDQDVTMNGSTAVTLDPPLSRITRIYVKEGTFASPSASVTVPVYASESTNTGLTAGLPSSMAYCKAIMPANINQTEKAATCTADGEYAAIQSVCATVPEAVSPTGTAAADINLEVRKKGGVFRPVGLELSIGAQQRTAVVNFDPPVIVPPNSDMRLVASASTTDLVVTGVVNGVLFKEHG